MKLSASEYIEAADTLQQCGIEGNDLSTALGHVCDIAGDTAYPEWLNTVRILADDCDTDHEFDLAISHTYGHDAVRTIRALVKARP